MRSRLTRRPSLVVPLAVLLLAAPFMPACKTVPGTGRSQFNIMSEESENQMGEQAYADMKQQSKLITSGKDYEMVQRVGARIADAAKQMYPDPAKDFDWEIVLIDEPKTVNAWCMPGGKMAVYTGLLPITQDEDSLAIVVGHEVGHAVARHGGERMSQDAVFQGVVQAVSMGTGKMDPGQRDALMQALTGVGTYGVMLPFSRSHESEADELGLYLAADAGYDPQAALGLWDRMGAASAGGAPPEFLSTHPSEASRKEHLKELMPKALKIREQSNYTATK